MGKAHRNMHYSTIGRRASRQLDIVALKVCDARANPSVENLLVRKAAAAHCVKKSTLSDEVLLKLCGVTKKSPGRKSSFTEVEEQVVVQMWLKYADRGVPLDLRHVREAFCFLAAGLESERHAISEKWRGHKFLRSFEKRHKHQLHCRRPLRQEGQRLRAFNAELPTTHFAAIENLAKEHNIDTARMWNLDETGGIPGREFVRRKSTRFYSRRN